VRCHRCGRAEVFDADAFRLPLATYVRHWRGGLDAPAADHGRLRRGRSMRGRCWTVIEGVGNAAVE
jgi:hypothetical protein